MNKITIELCTEDRARIDALFQELVNVRRLLAGAGAGVLTSEAVKTLAQHISAEEKEAIFFGQSSTAQETPGPKAAPEPAPAAPKQAAPEPTPTPREVTVAELQAKVVELVNAGKKAETREIILKYAQNVGSIPAEKRAEVLGLLNGLEG